MAYSSNIFEASDARKEKDTLCGICLENVIEKEFESDRKYGIMQNCDHTFCFGCIKAWRNVNQDLPPELRRPKKSCPTCRRDSDVVAPCLKQITDPMEKEKLIQEYRIMMKCVDCEVNKQHGVCPEGVNCLYRHDETNVQPSPARFSSSERFHHRNSTNLFGLTNVICLVNYDQLGNPRAVIRLDGVLDSLQSQI
ncbi:probable E3 ubiquitin-protein ligase makorin-1 [Uloborus diversus]|uniref:probable E3 ubiquitin-protein ligase makorin-1 n=1 Tax=Uloborus diversus TaxID=327109 RepID=UPI0024090463|nr:probable E3 ubiquitin-protein ligase makorin-1 [Uloborus diversus]